MGGHLFSSGFASRVSHPNRQVVAGNQMVTEAESVGTYGILRRPQFIPSAAALLRLAYKRPSVITV